MKDGDKLKNILGPCNHSIEIEKVTFSGSADDDGKESNDEGIADTQEIFSNVIKYMGIKEAKKHTDPKKWDKMFEEVTLEFKTCLTRIGRKQHQIALAEKIMNEKHSRS